MEGVCRTVHRRIGGGRSSDPSSSSKRRYTQDIPRRERHRFVRPSVVLTAIQIRFSNDKTPYKTGFSASFSRSGRKGIFAGCKSTRYLSDYRLTPRSRSHVCCVSPPSRSHNTDRSMLFPQSRQVYFTAVLPRRSLIRLQSKLEVRASSRPAAGVPAGTKS